MTRAVHRLSHRRARELIDQARRDRRDSYPRSTRVCIFCLACWMKERHS